MAARPQPLCVLLVASLFLTRVATAQNRDSVADVDRSNPDVAAIVQVAADFSAAYAAGDADRMLSYYSPDVVYMAAGMGNHVGRSSLRDAYASLFASYTGHVDVHLEEVKVFGDMAYDRATFRITLAPKAGGQATVTTGRLLEVLRKEDGKWRSVRVMTNSTS
jgi:uncharacterized protein (TIGR02246 family)